MDLTPDQAAIAVERNDCPKCEAPAGSACRTRGGKTATKYHTARFILVPALREELDVLVPEDRGPGRPWKQGPGRRCWRRPDTKGRTRDPDAIASHEGTGRARCYPRAAHRPLRALARAARTWSRKPTPTGTDRPHPGE
ncbi:zinc finger domain-containing protein [Streptomyces sp. NPDC002486]